MPYVDIEDIRRWKAAGSLVEIDDSAYPVVLVLVNGLVLGWFVSR